MDGVVLLLRELRRISQDVFGCFDSYKHMVCVGLTIACTVRGQNGLSDAIFARKMDIFKQTILNIAYIKTLEIFPSARESLSIQTSTSRSVRNQSCLHYS